MHLERPYYVSDLIVYLLHGLGVEYVTLNPGATTRGMHESLVTYGGNAAPEVITCSHEEVAVAMAEGYYLATGRPQATLVHNIVGLQHASKAIYEACSTTLRCSSSEAPGRWTRRTVGRGSTGSTPRRSRRRSSATTSSGTTSLRGR